MIASMTAYLRHIPQLAGVEVLLGEGGSFSANVALVRRAGRKVYFVRGEYGLTSYRAIKEHVPQGMPVMFVIGGKGVIHRAVAGGSEETGAELLKRILPNAKPDDFYMQMVDLDDITMVSVVRRSVVDASVGDAETFGLATIGAALGPFSLSIFGDAIFGGHTGGYTVGRHRMTLREGRITGYDLLAESDESDTKRVDVGGEQLTDRLAVAFASAFLAISEIPSAQLPVADAQHRASEYRGRWAFRRSAVVLMAFFIIVLLGNAFFFLHYSDSIADLAGSDGLSIQREIDELQRQSAERDALLYGLQHAAVPRWGMSFMADRLAGTVPEGILLDELALYPRDEGMSRKERRPVHLPAVIRIRGTCMDVTQLNGWVGAVRKLAFCRALEIDSYAYDERSGAGVFALKITLEP
ncbi:hypothetical protein ACFOET_06920 [Parapedobacter deserti]|uniref:Fimbrial assembly protein n=1 Tax=Parapedobacter deserti TaxID=1912957 RepID=A0ABV7JKG0_9SPHI